jgi:uncharacterized protein
LKSIHRKPIFAIAIVTLVICVSLATWTLGYLLSKPARASIGKIPNDLIGQDIAIPITSEIQLRGWYVPADGSKAVILLLHGVRGNRLAMLDRARFLHRAGYSTVLIDLRAHGESDGDQITFGARESGDVKIVVDYVRTRFAKQKLAVIGTSLGGAATLLAADTLKLDALVIESVYPTIEQAITDRLTMRLGAIGSAFVPLLTLQLKPRIGFTAKDLRPIDYIGKITAPIFIISGSEDQHTKIQETRALFSAAREPKQLWEVEGAAHVDLHRYGKNIYEQKVLTFLARTLSRREDSSEPIRSSGLSPNLDQ